MERNPVYARIMASLSPWQILASVLPMYGLIILGGCLRKAGILQREADSSIMRLVINCLYPCLIIDKILASEAVKDASLVAWTLPVGFLVIILGLAISRLGGRLFRLPAGPDRNTFSCTTGIQNYGFAAVPIVMALFPEDLLGVLFVHSLGVEIALWTFGIATLQGRLPREFKSLLTAPVIAVVVGLVLVFTGLGDWLTQQEALSPPLTIMNWLGGCSFPIALMLVGATLSDELRASIPTLRVGVAATSIRLLILPCLIIGLIYLIPLPSDLKTILLVQAAMPSAVMPIVLSRIYGGNPAIAGQVVITTQVIGILTIPLWISLGLQLIGSGS